MLFRSGFQVHQPMTFGVAGFKYFVRTSGAIKPYVLAGGGLAQVSKNVVFTVGGNDVTANLTQYGVVLGADLAGNETKPLVNAGAGVVVPVSRLFLDINYRFGRVFTSGSAMSVSRAGAAIGVRF